MTHPEIIYKVEPEYTEQARKAGVSGSAILSIVVDKDGVPKDIKVISPLPDGLAEQAIQAVSKWRFKPGTQDGVPVATMAKIEVNFRICVPPCRGGPDPNYERLERARGQYNTAVHQLRGDIDKKDTKAAFASMKRSADLGFAPAEVMMGVFYLEGIETAVDEKQAAEWFDRAAAQGSAKGLYELGWLHETGKGTNVDRAEALRLYLRAAEKNFPEAQCAAGILLEEGNGVPQDVDQAQKWYRKSADQGLALAQYRLAKAYWGGVFGRQDQVKALTWALIASSGGEKRSNAAVQEYRAGMAEEQIRAAEREAARFKPHPAAVTQ